MNGSDEYDVAEILYMDALRADAIRGVLTVAARRVEDAASEFDDEANMVLRAGAEDAVMPVDRLSERTDVLAGLWCDIATAYEDDPRTLA